MASNYVDINQIPTTGASPETGRQDGKSISGVYASEQLARTDLEKMSRYKTKIKNVAHRTGIDPAIIAAIISRESRAGSALDGNGRGDHGNAYGLMQIDKHWHTARGAWDSEEHISQGTEILCGIHGDVKRRFPNWTNNQQMKAALAGYNMGLDSIRSFDTIDNHTTGRDYSNDVIARAQFFKRHGY